MRNKTSRARPLSESNARRYFISKTTKVSWLLLLGVPAKKRRDIVLVVLAERGAHREGGFAVHAALRARAHGDLVLDRRQHHDAAALLLLLRERGHRRRL